ncbi:MAG: hypothetical protein ABIR35_00280 [Polaromonas sp.]
MQHLLEQAWHVSQGALAALPMLLLLLALKVIGLDLNDGVD